MNLKGKIRHVFKKCGMCRKQFTVKVATLFEEAPAGAARHSS